MATRDEIRELLANANEQISQSKKQVSMLDESIGKRVSEIEILVYKELLKKESEITNPIHHKVCEQMAELHKKYNVPMPYIAVVAVASNAHKLESFYNGYSKCDSKMFSTIVKWAKLFAEHNGKQSFEKQLPTYQLMARYYKYRSKNTNQFAHDLNSFPIAKHLYGVREMAIMLHVGSLENILFQNEPQRDERGRFIKQG